MGRINGLWLVLALVLPQSWGNNISTVSIDLDFRETRRLPRSCALNLVRPRKGGSYTAFKEVGQALDGTLSKLILRDGIPHHISFIAFDPGVLEGVGLNRRLYGLLDQYPTLESFHFQLGVQAGLYSLHQIAAQVSRAQLVKYLKACDVMGSPVSQHLWQNSYTSGK